ncbi:MAG: MFS transporter [Deltaproteobacteria bacterium]|nr:MFS transporter [Deltaproteobacteria bacterium]
MPARPASPSKPPSRRGLILLTACLGAFMATLDTSIVNIALPQIAREFHSTLSQISWVMVIYLLVNLSLLLTSGRLGDLLAPGRLYLLGLLSFTGASVLCGLSPGLPELVAARALQGVGASLMLGLAPKLIALSYGEGERGLALGLFSTAFATGISVGAPLGGLITSYLGWPYIFFINIPICLLVLLVGGRSLWDLKAQMAWAWRAFDLWGSLVLTLALGSLLLGLTRVREAGWGDGLTAGALALGAGLVLVLIFLERRQPAPLIHGELWRRWPFVVGSTAVVLCFAAVMGTFFLLPFFLEQVYRYSPDQTGLLLSALSLTNAAVAGVGGYLADRWGNMLVLRSGCVLILAGLVSLLFTGVGDTTLGLAARFILLGLGFGLFQAPNLSEVLRGVKPSQLGLAASTNAVLKNLGALTGITLMVTVFAWLDLHRVRLGLEAGPGLDAYHWAFAAAVLVAGLNLIANLLPRNITKIPRQDAKSPKQKR